VTIDRGRGRAGATPLVDRASVRESVVFLAVGAIREVAQQHTLLAENGMG